MTKVRLFSSFSFREVRDIVFIVVDLHVGNRVSMESSRKRSEYCSRVGSCFVESEVVSCWRVQATVDHR